MQAACWYVLLLLQPTVYLVSRERSSIFGDSTLTERSSTWCGGGGEKEGEAISSVRAVLPETVNELWEAVLWIPAGVFGVLIPFLALFSPSPNRGF